MKIFTTLLLFTGIIFLHSCTVEKRLHSNGYHVTRIKKFKGPDSRLSTENLPLREEIREEPSLQNNQPIASDQQVKEETVAEPKSENQPFVHSDDSKSISKIIQKISNRNDKPGNSKSVIKKQKEQKAQIKREKKERSNNGRALLLLINAIIFALLGLVFVAYFGVFGLIFGIIFYTAALIMIIASIIYLIL